MSRNTINTLPDEEMSTFRSVNFGKQSISGGKEIRLTNSRGRFRRNYVKGLSIGAWTTLPQVQY